MKFDLIKNIVPEDEASWKDKVFLTFDIDWCSDEVLAHTMAVLNEYNTPATFFITHHTALLEDMQGNENVELGIHPNFNPLMAGDFRYGSNVQEVIEHYKSIVPDASSVRSHSMTQNSVILDAFVSFGLTRDCNTFLPYTAGTGLAPYRHWNAELIKVPYCWEDDVHCLYGWQWDADSLLSYHGIKVLDFHPVHVYLNTEHMDRYESSRAVHHSRDLAKHSNGADYGVADFLTDILKGVN